MNRYISGTIMLFCNFMCLFVRFYPILSVKERFDKVKNSLTWRRKNWFARFQLPFYFNMEVKS